MGKLKMGRMMATQWFVSVCHWFEIRLWVLSYRLEESRAAHAAAGRLKSEAACRLCLSMVRWMEGRHA